MNNLPLEPAVSESMLAELRTLSTQQLKAQLAECLGNTARELLRMAMLVRAIEEKGEDLGEIKTLGILSHLRKIACGMLLPEVVVQFAGKPQLIGLIGGLPLNEQQAIAAGKPVRLLVYDPVSGQRTHRMANPLDMTPRQVRQVFARDHIRRDEEQALILDDKREQAKQPIPEKVGQMKIDRERKGVTIGRYFISFTDMRAALRVGGDS